MAEPFALNIAKNNKRKAKIREQYHELYDFKRYHPSPAAVAVFQYFLSHPLLEVMPHSVVEKFGGGSHYRHGRHVRIDFSRTRPTRALDLTGAMLAVQRLDLGFTWIEAYATYRGEYQYWTGPNDTPYTRAAQERLEAVERELRASGSWV
jgi:hypothetical protein